jgi:hypothetical protein
MPKDGAQGNQSHMSKVITGQRRSAHAAMRNVITFTDVAAWRTLIVLDWRVDLSTEARRRFQTFA